MSIDGIYKIINNDGIQDKLIMATDRLKARLLDIGTDRLVQLRQEYPGMSDEELLLMDQSWMPSLASIEKTHVLFVNATYKPFVALASSYSKSYPKSGSLPRLGTTVAFTMPLHGEFVNDAVVNIRLENFKAIDTTNKVRYVEMLGHRLFKNTRFVLGQHILDSYTADKYNIHWQYKVPTGKETGYLRNMGQEIPSVGTLTADPANDEVREYRYFGSGPQTFKTTQPAIDLWIPLLFWFKDVNTSLPNFLFPYGQTDIQIDLESEANLVAYANYSNTTGPVYTPPTITACTLYMNHLFLLPEIHQIFISKFGFQLIRVTRQQNLILQNSSNSVLLNNIRWPVESLYVGFRPVANLTRSDRWHRNTAIKSKSVQEAVIVNVGAIVANNAIYYEESPVVSSIMLRAHDITLFPEAPPAFYNSYMPYAHGPNLKTPKDLGWMLFNFCINPGEYQPSGHFNASQSREITLQYISAIDPDPDPIGHTLPPQPYINESNPVELLVHAECINFLLVNNNMAVLRFST
jgi:hypothetical protein